jgi:hypothetical protein
MFCDLFGDREGIKFKEKQCSDDVAYCIECDFEELLLCCIGLSIGGG